MALWGKNIVKVDLASYFHYWRGIPKVGKTTMFYDLINELYDGDFSNGLLISIGKEMGHKALDGLYVAETPEWADFVEVVDELVENKNNNNFKFIGLDTVDELFSIGTDEVLRLHTIKYQKKAESINGAFGGYGAGKEKLLDIVGEQIAKLRYAGYGIIAIGHTKVRNIKEKMTGEEYQQLSTSLTFDLDALISNQADIIATMVIDKDIQDGKLSAAQRYIMFRDDGYAVDCGSRFANIPNKVPMSAKNYIDAVTQAIKSASGKTDKEIEKLKKKEVKEREEKADTYIKQQNAVNIDKNKELITEITQKIQSATDKAKEKMKEIMQEYKVTSFKDVDSIQTEALEKIVQVL